MTRILLLSLAILCSTFAKAQSDEHQVMMQYPEVYKSINSYIDQNVSGQMNAQAKKEQYTAFLDLAESNEQYQDDAMTSAILKWSLNGETAYNRSIIDDENINNPFMFLRCNWYAVKSEYYKAVNTTAVATGTQSVRPMQQIQPAQQYPTESRQPRQNYGNNRQAVPATSLSEYSNYNQNQYNNNAPATHSRQRQGVPATSLSEYSNYAPQGYSQRNMGTRQPIPATSLKEYSHYGQPTNYNYNQNYNRNYKHQSTVKDKSNFRQFYSDQYKQVYSDQYQKEMEVINGQGLNAIGDGYYYDNTNSNKNVCDNGAVYIDPYQPAIESTEPAAVEAYPSQGYRRQQNESTTRYQNNDRRREAPQSQQYEVSPQQRPAEAAPQFYRKGR